MSDDQSEAKPQKPTYVASHPGRIRAELVRFLRYNPLPGLKYISGFAILSMVVLALLGTRLFVLPRGNDGQYAFVVAFAAAAIVCLAQFRSYWKSVKRHFQIGCANPAIVVTERPLRIGVYTDMARSGDGSFSFPVIKVLRARLGRAGDPKPRLGDRFVTVSCYWGRHDQTPYWDDFDPRPAVHATSDSRVLITLAESLGSEEWRILEEGLRALPLPITEGIYPIPVARPLPRHEPSEN